MRGNLTDQGIILQQIRVGEADKLFKILTNNNGLIVCIAKGVRRLSSKKSAHLDTLNLIKFQTGRGDSPYYLNQVDSLETFSKLKNDLKKTRTALYLAEVLVQVLPENEADPSLYNLFLRFIHDLNNVDDSYRDLAIDFQHRLIDHLGFPAANINRPEDFLTYFENLLGKRLASRRFKLNN